MLCGNNYCMFEIYGHYLRHCLHFTNLLCIIQSTDLEAPSCAGFLKRKTSLHVWLLILCEHTIKTISKCSTDDRINQLQ